MKNYRKECLSLDHLHLQLRELQLKIAKQEELVEHLTGFIQPKVTKPVGMVHLQGINDKAFTKFISNQS